MRQPRPMFMSPPGSARTPPRARSRRSAAPIARWSAPTIAGRAITSTSQPGRSDGSIDRIDLAKPASNAVPDDGRAERPTRRQAESRRPELGPEDPSGEERVRPDRPSLLERREVLGRRASRAATAGRARPSDRQTFPTAGPACRQDAASARRLHSGAEAVFLGAMSLLGLVGLLHRACAGSSPSGLGARSDVRPQKARKRARAPTGAGAFVVRGMIGRPTKGCQTVGRVRTSREDDRAAGVRRGARRRAAGGWHDGSRRPRRARGRAAAATAETGAPVATAPSDTPGEYREIRLAGVGMAVLCFGRHPTRPSRTGD